MPLGAHSRGARRTFSVASRAQVNSCAPTTSRLRGDGSCTLCRPEAPGRQGTGHLKGTGPASGQPPGAAQEGRKTPSRPWERQRLALTTPDDSCTIEHPHKAATTTNRHRREPRPAWPAVVVAGRATRERQGRAGRCAGLVGCGVGERCGGSRRVVWCWLSALSCVPSTLSVGDAPFSRGKRDRGR